ncbi:hypothetical protein lerEdw1_009746 [Lerista edwardsae]|nr:hypothetical protein lerEdw1_009746 [Lerista edwardsae]
MLCGFISLLLLLTALGSPYWVELRGVTMGLWRACFDGPGLFGPGLDPGIRGCIPLRVVDDSVHATRAFLILGMLAGFISCGLLSLLCFRSELGSYSVARIASISGYVAGILALIAMAIFTGSVGATNAYRWSFGLGWACGPLFLVTGERL